MFGGGATLNDKKILTEDDILNISKYELIYDKSSSDPNINWGYTDGIKNKVNVENKDFSKYKGLFVYGTVNYASFRFYIDLEANLYGGNDSFGGAAYTTLQKGISAKVWKNKTAFLVESCYQGTSEIGDNQTGFVYKIEGVLL